MQNEVPFDQEKLLLSKISLGDELAFRILFNKHRKWVYSYVLKIIKSNLLAEEILHDVFLKIWQHQNLNEIENLTSYLKIITRNKTLNVLRRTNLEVLVNNKLCDNWEEAHNETQEIILLNDSVKVLNQAIELLTPQQKLVYNLCKHEGLKYAQVAKQLSISPLTVKTHMQHTLRFLRSYLKKYNGVPLLIICFELLTGKK
ncbi:MAG: sigma-70 family RNA polymerase sigma factor [Sphingobacteriaceae bacterium]|nr:MAG: sigma-70 family RNA polymerase sigma factor [Sphingobacteriaceae bacterium]